MTWYDILKSLRDYLVALPTTAGEGVTMLRPARYIEGGALSPDDMDLSADADGLTGAIFLIRDREPDEKIHHGGEGVVVFFVENWVRCDDPDPIDGYKVLSDQENAFRAALNAWFYSQQADETNDVNADLMNLEIDDVIGDADSRRPILGSRTTIRITWSKRTI